MGRSDVLRCFQCSFVVLGFLMLSGVLAPATALTFAPGDDVEILQAGGPVCVLDPYDDVISSNMAKSRDSAEDFRNLVYMSLRELAREGRLNPEILTSKRSEVAKRGRHQGFCFKRTRSGRFLPYICWKENDSSK